MSSQTETQASPMDTLKWVLVFGILGAVVAGNYFLSEQVSVLIRAVAIIAAVAVAALIALQTVKGREGLAFAKEARLEVRKVVWPTRKESTNTTLIVMAAVGIMSLILWGLDGIIFRLVAFITHMEL